MRPEYSFHKATRADYPLLTEWLRAPHIAGWWDAPDDWIDRIDKEIDSPARDMRIVAYKGHAFAFVQDYPADRNPAMILIDRLPTSRALDTFLGDEAYLGKGHAKAYLMERATELEPVYGAVLVDPDINNSRAIAAYAGAGFNPLCDVQADPNTHVRIMEFRHH